ncbi:MAG: ABC transporter substrate-binding protein [Pseudomonadota bacterium]
MKAAVRILLGLIAAWAPQIGLAGPERVVSMNLCTDQLALLLGPEQVISISYLAQDPRSSAMAEEAAAYPSNRGLAEEIFLMQPDLVIAGSYTTRATVDMLRRLGVRVEIFRPADNLADIRDRVRKMGEVLGNPGRSDRLIAQFDTDLASVQRQDGPGLRAATYYANGYTSGPGTLADDLMRAAGLRNIAGEFGQHGGGYLALEALVMANPDLLITGQPFESPALADEILAHPALDAIREGVGKAPVADRDWICGTPFVIAAIRRLAAARDAVLAR